MHGEVLQPNMGRRGGVYIGGGDFEIPGKDVVLVRQRLAGGPPECWKVTPSMESDEETAKEEGGRTMIVYTVLLGGGPVDTPYVTRVTIGFLYLQ